MTDHQCHCGRKVAIERGRIVEHLNYMKTARCPRSEVRVEPLPAEIHRIEALAELDNAMADHGGLASMPEIELLEMLLAARMRRRRRQGRAG